MDAAVAALRAGREQPEQNSDPATPDGLGAGQHESGEQPDAAPPQEPSGETEEIDRAGEPPIDAPRSWTKADREVFAGLPRDTQQRLVEIDRTRELEIRRGQNEVAEQTRQAQAAALQAEQVRQQYESSLPNALTVLQAEMARDFPDVQTMDDVRRMAQEDPARYVDWQSRVQMHEGYQRQWQAAQEKRSQEQAQAFDRYSMDEAAKFIAKAPEFADPAKAATLQAEAAATLEDLGFEPNEIQAAWTGQPVSIRDHRVQLLIRDATRWRSAQKALKAAAPKPVQPVQRPGIAPAKGEKTSAKVQELEQRLLRSHAVDDAVALMRAKRRAS